MKQLVKKTAGLVKNFKRKPVVIGYIEKIDHFSIEGWAIDQSGSSLEVALTYNDKIYTLYPRWFQRADVAETMGNSYSQAGFYAELPVEIVTQIKLGQINAEDFHIQVNNTRLKITAQLPEATLDIGIDDHHNQVVDRDGLASPENITNENVDVPCITSNGYFILKGKVLECEDGDVITLVCNGLDVECSGYLVKKPEYSDFHVEIPGYIWEHVDGIGEIATQVKVNESIVNELPIILKKSDVITWLNNISNMQGQDKQYFSLLAIEHLRFSGFIGELSEAGQAYYQLFAKSMQLEQYLSNKKQLNLNNDVTSSLKINPIDPTTSLLWKMQKQLNTRLADNKKTVFQHVEDVISENRLSGNVLDGFIQSIIPLLCRHKQLLELRKVTNFAKLYALDHSDNNWLTSLSIAPLVADGQIRRATDVLWRLAKSTEGGWLNTECVYFAVCHTQLLESTGAIEGAVAERFRYAFTGLLSGFHGEWFSRLHDQLLIDSMIHLLDHLDTMNDYHQRDMVKAAIEHYGMNPVFWEHLSEAKVKIDDNFFAQADKHWHCIFSAVQAGNEAINKNISAIHRALQFFMHHENPEAHIYLREILACLIAQGAEAVEEHIYQSLIDLNSMESLRFSASPLALCDRLKALLDENSSNTYDALRLETERDNSVLYGAQLRLSGAVTMLTNINEKKVSELEKNFIEIMDSATPLNTWNGMFLSADMLAAAYHKCEKLIDAEIGLIKLEQSVQKAIGESKADFYLPAAVCTAIQTLVALNESAVVKGWLQNIQMLVSAKFTVSHQQLFEKMLVTRDIVKPAWPHDTLVVIYSCRKYLDSRVEAIRTTWVKDLNRRGIPYVVLVGDGDDTVEGDVLALNVSDTYEELPQKTLKMFEWVYKNTNAQYVLKIDDDCYLDVDKYFDTLSYRKHHYYGRVIHRNAGGMDRAWHHSKSQSERARKAIDKSPEPSIYADGGGAYSLSRLAISVLLDNAKSAEGQQLIANSFMEDKLMGDLLAISHIQPSNEDYECYQRRRTFGEATPVGMFENTFFPGKNTPVKIVHLDTDKDQELVWRRKEQQDFWPKKIWSTCYRASIRENNNQLELLADISKTNNLLKEDFFVVGVMRNEMIMLPHFLKYYRGKGVKAFILADNCSDDGTREYLLDQDDVVLYSSDTEYKYSQYGVAWQQAILANHCLNKWVLVADADELLVYPGCEALSLQNFVKKYEKDGVDCIRTDMIDMYPYGDLNDADFQIDDPFNVASWFDKSPLREWRIGSGKYSNRTSCISSLRHRIDPNSEPNSFTSQKYALMKYKPWFRLSQGIHDIAGAKIERGVKASFAHFKYHSGFKKKIEAEIERGQHFDNAKEYKRYAAMLAEGKGCFGVESVSVKYSDFDSLV